MKLNNNTASDFETKCLSQNIYDEYVPQSSRRHLVRSLWKGHATNSTTKIIFKPNKKKKKIFPTTVLLKLVRILIYRL